MNKRKITSFSMFINAVGMNISYTFAEIDGTGNIVKDNVRGTFVVNDTKLESDINSILKALQKQVDEAKI